MPMPPVVGLSSQKQMGKNAVAERLSRNLALLGEEWKERSFATPVKEIFCQTFGKDFDFIERWKESPQPPPGMERTVREALIFIGDGFRSIDPNIWIKKAFDQNSHNRIFTDARYFNEVRRIKQEGGAAILIFRPQKLNFMESASESQIRPILQWCYDRGGEGPIKEWDSYQAFVRGPERDGEFAKTLSLFDYFLLNDGTLEGLYEKIDNKLLPYLMSFKSHL